MQYPGPIAKLINSFTQLPGIGAKTAARLAFYALEMDETLVTEFAQNLINVKRDLCYCSVCGNVTETDPCFICQDDSREKNKVLVVEDSKAVMSLERINEYRGQYHVLHGVISPMEGVSPSDLNISALFTRLQDETIDEVIIATNATPEGEATAMYLARMLKPAGIKVTRLAHGLSVGSDIEYADEMTLFRAIEGRREL